MTEEKGNQVLILSLISIIIIFVIGLRSSTFYLTGSILLFASLFLLYQNQQKVNSKKTSLTKATESTGNVTEKDEPATATEANTPAKTDHLIHNLPDLKERFMKLADEEIEPVGDGPEHKWNQVLHQSKGDFSISVQKRVGGDFFFRIVCDFEATPEEAFDYLSDIDIRAKWDELTVESGLVERVSNQTSVLFMHSRGLWPTAARDALVMSFISRGSDGSYTTITKSLESHPQYQDRQGSVRMLAKLAALKITKHKSGNPNLCHCVQIIDGIFVLEALDNIIADLGGWLPPSIVSLVSTQAFPLSMGRANSQMKEILNHRTISKLIEQSESTTAVVPATSVTANPATTERKEASSGTVGKKSSVLMTTLRLLEKSQPVLVLVILFLILKIRK